MATVPLDPEGYRRRQRRRALIGWIVGFAVIAAIFGLGAVFGADHHQRHTIKVPYGDVMTSRDFEEIHLGEEDRVVLERLAATDEPDVFARLCFATDDGELVDKRSHSVLHPPVEGQGTVV